MAPASGLSAFPITPADAEGRVDTAALRRLVARPAAAGTDSIGLLGSTGIYMYLSREERRRAVYALAGLVGLCHAAPPRPILPLPPAARDEVAAALARLAPEMTR